MTFAALRSLPGIGVFQRLPPLSVNTVLQLLGALLGLGGQYLINEQNWVGFVLWLGSNAALIALQFRTRLFVLVVLHVIYFALCVHGLVNWIR